jgi:nucleoside-diphosphate-sugar epimerase
MSNMSKKQITVFGATGAQGSSVLRSLSQNTTTPFSLRGTTRNPTSTASKSLLEQVPDLDLVQADGWDKASTVAAFRGSWGAFVNTNSDDAVFENPEETRTEVDLGKIIVDAAIEAGVEVLVYSGFNSAKEITGGKVTNPAFDGTCYLSMLPTRSNIHTFRQERHRRIRQIDRRVQSRRHRRRRLVLRELPQS